MPQITFEYTRNIAHLADYRALVPRLHEVIAREIETDIGSCKTRLVEVGDFVVGDGAADEAFVHVAIAVLSGRTAERKARASQAALALVCSTVPEDGHRAGIQITVEIRDLDGAAYAKHVVERSISRPA